MLIDVIKLCCLAGPQVHPGFHVQYVSFSPFSNFWHVHRCLLSHMSTSPASFTPLHRSLPEFWLGLILARGVKAGFDRLLRCLSRASRPREVDRAMIVGKDAHNAEIQYQLQSRATGDVFRIYLI